MASFMILNPSYKIHVYTNSKPVTKSPGAPHTSKM